MGDEMDINILSTILGVVISIATLTTVIIAVLKKAIIKPMIEPLVCNIEKQAVLFNTLIEKVAKIEKEQQEIIKKQQDEEIKLARIDERVKNML